MYSNCFSIIHSSFFPKRITISKYGKISLLSNEIYIGGSFKDGKYWDEDILLKLRDYVNPDRNILEIGDIAVRHQLYIQVF